MWSSRWVCPKLVPLLEESISTTSTRESSRRVSQASGTLTPKNHLFNTHKTDLFSQVMRDNSQLLILSTLNWIFQVPQTQLTGKSLKPGTRDCRRNPALMAVQGNSVPASHRDLYPCLSRGHDFTSPCELQRFLPTHHVRVTISKTFLRQISQDIYKVRKRFTASNGDLYFS